MSRSMLSIALGTSAVAGAVIFLRSKAGRKMTNAVRDRIYDLLQKAIDATDDGISH